MKLGGSYTISAPAISEGWGISDGMKLRFCQSSSGRHIWGDFDFEFFCGTFRSERLSPSQKGKIKCHWRGRETGEGESTFDPENVLELEFIDENIFQGLMYCTYVGKFDIVGKLDREKTRNQVFKMSIRKWKDNYRTLNEANWDAECKNKWGGWTQDAKPDPAAESDTTNDEPSDQEDDD